MYCSKCGSVVAEGAMFCGACGQPVNAPPVAAAVPAAAPIPASLPSPFAGFWLRLVAYVIDQAVLGVVFGILALVIAGFVGIGYLRSTIEGMQNPDAVFPAGLIVLIVVFSMAATLITWLYYAWMESSPNQATLGKMALGLSVTDLQGRRISFGRATGRVFAKVISGLIPLAIGYIMAGFTAKKQALHDMIAECLVLRKT
jgi:uncharacterized RDD family membrane protein YckC